MRYEAVLLFVLLGLLFETGVTFAAPWTALFPVLTFALILAALTITAPRARRIVGIAAEITSAASVVAYLALSVLWAGGLSDPSGAPFPEARAAAAWAGARLGLAILALFGAVFLYGTAHELLEARPLPAVEKSERYPSTVRGYSVLRANMSLLFGLNGALALILAVAAEITVVLVYTTGAWDPRLVQGAVEVPVRYGAVAGGYLLAALGLAGSVVCLRGAGEVGGDQPPVIAVAVMLWTMSLLIHFVTSVYPVVPGAIVAALALSATTRTMSNFYSRRKRLRLWFITILVGFVFPAPASFLARRAGTTCDSLGLQSPGLEACTAFLGEAASLVAVFGSIVFGYIFAQYYTNILSALKATRAVPRPAAA